VKRTNEYLGKKETQTEEGGLQRTRRGKTKPADLREKGSRFFYKQFQPPISVNRGGP